jgi:hypothetical protein
METPPPPLGGIDPGKETDGLRPGDEVLVVSNNHEPWAGTMVGWQRIRGGQHPVVENFQGEKFIVFGILLPIGLAEVFTAKPIDVKYGWELACKISHTIQCVHRKARDGKD